MRDKTESSASERSEVSLPFFARFLEGQDASKNAEQTLKYPSDRDEFPDFAYMSDNNGR